MADKNSIFYNRELSWLEFDKRCLSEAKDKTIPLFERIKFLSITASNLDEFFMVRIASLTDMVHAGYTKKDIAGMTPQEQLDALHVSTKEFMKNQYQTLNRSLIPQLAQNGLKLVRHYEDLTPKQAKYVDKYFEKDVTEIILLEEVIEKNLDKLFLSYDIVCAYPYRIMRNADFSIDEEETADLLKEIEKQLKQRQWGEVIRLEVDEAMDKKLLKELKNHLGVDDEVVYKINGPLDLTFLMKVNGIEGFEHLKYPKYKPQPVPGMGDYSHIFDRIRKGDILLFHPYYEFTPVIEFIRQAANDPDVLAIKQTLYRVSGNSPIIAALAQAAENGKQVTVLVELKARFDEENNIAWAKKLEQAGCHVIYGLVGLKTHSKIALVVRREEDGIRRYVHLGTGNYNDQTAKLYTDMGLLTCSDAIGEDATAVFNMLSGYSEPKKWNKLAVAPIWLKDKFLMLIGREAENARQGKKARIVAKMNSLCDPVIMNALYDASKAGVKIDLIVRGICCIKAGVPGLSENISVRSIVGNYLEHSRIFYFYNDGFEDIYMGSADWMPRNLDKRVEITFPVEDPGLKTKVKEILQIQLADTLKAHIMQPDGSYVKQDLRGKNRLDSQMYFVKKAQAGQEIDGETENTRVFIPIESHEDEEDSQTE